MRTIDCLSTVNSDLPFGKMILHSMIHTSVHVNPKTQYTLITVLPVYGWWVVHSIKKSDVATVLHIQLGVTMR